MVFLVTATATVFWLFNALNKPYDATVSYPISWEFDTEEYIIVEKLPSTLRINVRGLGWNLLRASLGLKVNPINIVLANPAASKRIPGISLTNRVDDSLEELQLNYILEDTIHTNVDYRDKRTFAVYVDSTGIALAENHRIISPVEYDIHLLEIEGPRAMLYENPSDSFLIKIPEKNIGSNYEENISFTRERPDLFRFNPPAVKIKFEVAEFVKTELLVPLELVNFPDNAKWSMPDTTCIIEYAVQRDLAETVVADSFKIVADYRLIKRADSTLMLRIEKVPPMVLESRITHPQVRVTRHE